MAYKKLKLWFDAELAIMLSDKILDVDSSFDKSSFVNSISKNVNSLELKDRVEFITDQLYVRTGENYLHGIEIFKQILGPKNLDETGMFTEYYWLMPVAKYVEKYGLEYFDESMAMIEEITKRNTGEYTIRPYLNHRTKETIKQMEFWSYNENFHVRRLASEGVRPRLPWAKKLDIFINDPSLIIPILNNLKDDSSKYVQKSVANCINDILKDNPKVATKLIEKWAHANISPARKWIIKHAIRNLRKKEDSWAISILAKLA